MINLTDPQRQALLQMRGLTRQKEVIRAEIFLELLDLHLLHNLGNGRLVLTPLGESVCHQLEQEWAQQQ